MENCECGFTAKKRKEPSTSEAYRPISLLPTLCKVYERTIRSRIHSEIENVGGLFPHQYGFRMGRSTTDGVKHVITQVSDSSAKCFDLILFYIRNAFNTVKWDYIHRGLAEMGISKCIRHAIRSYLHDIHLTRCRNRLTMETGVTQGSVLEPTLWNIVYDGVLRIPLFRKATTVAYADDLALIVKVRDTEELSAVKNINIAKIYNWLRNIKLDLEVNNTESILLKGHRLDLSASIYGCKMSG